MKGWMPSTASARSALRNDIRAKSRRQTRRRTRSLADFGALGLPQTPPEATAVSTKFGSGQSQFPASLKLVSAAMDPLATRASTKFTRSRVSPPDRIRPESGNRLRMSWLYAIVPSKSAIPLSLERKRLSSTRAPARSISVNGRSGAGTKLVCAPLLLYLGGASMNAAAKSASSVAGSGCAVRACSCASRSCRYSSSHPVKRISASS